MTSFDIPFGRPYIDDAERQAVMEVLNGHILTHGPNCKAFEDGFVGMMGGGHAVTTSSCMASLHLSWIDLGIGPGDEVLVPSTTHVATIHAVALTGATPVFVESTWETGNIDLADLEAKISPKTKAISVVHYIGIPVDMAKVMALATKHGLHVVEDCALAVEARVDGRHVGLFGHTGCYSFYPVKHITSGEGGMLVSKDDKTLRRIASFRAFNYDRSDSPKVPGLYDVADVGMNYRMSEMQAAVGRIQLTKIPEIMQKRRANFQKLKAGLLSLDGVHVLDSTEDRLQSSYYCMVAILEGDLGPKRNDVALALNAAGVGTSVYYPHPTGRLKAYKTKSGFTPTAYANAVKIADHGLALPVGPHLTTADMDNIVTALERVLKTAI